MFEWNDLRIALTVARAGSTAAAARELGVNQSTVSRRLAFLASRTDVPLFERRGRSLVPTAAGHELVAAAERMETETHRLDRAMVRRSQGLRGVLRVTVVAPILHYILAGTLTRFVREHPDIELHVDASGSLADLERREADVAVRASDEPPAHLVGRRFARFGYALYTRRDRQETRSAIGYRPPRGDLAERPWFKERFAHVAVRVRVDDEASQLRFVRAGLGMAQLLCLVADGDPELVRVPDAPVEHGNSLWVLTHPELRRAHRVRAALDALHETLAAWAPRIEGRRAESP